MLTPHLGGLSVRMLGSVVFEASAAKSVIRNTRTLEHDRAP